MKKISLIKAKPPYKDKTKRIIEKVIKNAHYKDVDTGKFEVRKIIHPDGQEEEKRTQIYERIFVEAIKEEIELDVDVWIVETELNGHIEKHEFSDLDGANNYYGGF